MKKIMAEINRLRLMRHKTRKCGPRKNNNSKRREERMTKLEKIGNVIVVDERVI